MVPRRGERTEPLLRVGWIGLGKFTGLKHQFIRLFRLMLPYDSPYSLLDKKGGDRLTAAAPYD